MGDCHGWSVPRESSHSQSEDLPAILESSRHAPIETPPKRAPSAGFWPFAPPAESGASLHHANFRRHCRARRQPTNERTAPAVLPTVDLPAARLKASFLCLASRAPARRPLKLLSSRPEADRYRPPWDAPAPA